MNHLGARGRPVVVVFFCHSAEASVMKEMAVVLGGLIFFREETIIQALEAVLLLWVFVSFH